MRNATLLEAILAGDGAPTPGEVAAVNNKLGLVEREFLTSQGLPGRKWFRHPLQA